VGLDTDFFGHPFGPVPQLMAVADSVTKLTAVCVCCGAPAVRSSSSARRSRLTAMSLSAATNFTKPLPRLLRGPGRQDRLSLNQKPRPRGGVLSFSGRAFGSLPVQLRVGRGFALFFTVGFDQTEQLFAHLMRLRHLFEAKRLTSPAVCTYT